jgi:SAM-dependent methyltransferase
MYRSLGEGLEMLTKTPTAIYQNLLDNREMFPVDPKFFERTEYLLNGPLDEYEAILDSFQGSFEGKVALDFGCKYGHTLPLFLARGAKQVIGVDVELGYLETGRNAFGRLLEGIQYYQADDGLIPISSEIVDFALANEVISHVNPAYLETVYAELARVLRPGGQLLISDGNNIANAECCEALVDVYDAWENGPTGRQTDRDVVTVSYVERRRQIVRERHPTLQASDIEHVARNTSGLFGEKFLEIVDAYVKTGELLERPYRPGMCPTNPQAGGVVMERGFHPRQVEMALNCYGLEAHQVYQKPPWADPASLNWKGSLVQSIQKAWESVFGHHRPSNWWALSANFTILATKPKS